MLLRYSYAAVLLAVVIVCLAGCASPDDRLWDAVISGDVSAVKKALAQGVKPCPETLAAAVRNDKREIILLLLEYNEKLTDDMICEAVNRPISTATIEAMMSSGHMTPAQTLLVVQTTIESPLCPPDTISRLLDRCKDLTGRCSYFTEMGDDVVTVSSDGAGVSITKTSSRVLAKGSLLHLAAAEGHATCFEPLIAKGLDVCERDSLGNTPAMVARANKHLDAEKRLKILEENKGL